MVHFFPGAKIFDIGADISHTSCGNATKFGSLRGLANGHFFLFSE